MYDGHVSKSFQIDNGVVGNNSLIRGKAQN